MTGDSRPGRRRALAIFAAASGLKLCPFAASADQAWSWTGDALGAAARIELRHPDRTQARRLVEACVAELRRLETAFSLYRADSEVSRLNRDGYLDHPSPDLLAILRQARDWGERTDGAFDVTVQPLWRLHADHFADHPGDSRGPSPAALAAACALVDHRGVDIATGRIAFDKPGMAITLNGIAQGYITDRVVDRLRDAGISSTLVDMGEIAAHGLRGAETPWSVGVPDGRGGLVTILPLRDRAIATSAGHVTVFDPTGRFHHLFEPRTGACAGHVKAISVIADNATTADALSTALFVTPLGETSALLRQVALERKAVEAIVQTLDDRVLHFADGRATDLQLSIKSKKGLPR